MATSSARSGRTRGPTLAGLGTLNGNAIKVIRTGAPTRVHRCSVARRDPRHRARSICWRLPFRYLLELSTRRTRSADVTAAAPPTGGAPRLRLREARRGGSERVSGNRPPALVAAAQRVLRPDVKNTPAPGAGNLLSPRFPEMHPEEQQVVCRPSCYGAIDSPRPAGYFLSAPPHLRCACLRPSDRPFWPRYSPCRS